VRAVRFMRRNACRPIRVTDVVAHVRIPRTTLQIRVKNVIGCTIHQEIKRVQIARARELLSSTNTPIKRVARESGFANVQYFSRAFHQATGETPAGFKRRRMQMRVSESGCGNEIPVTEPTHVTRIEETRCSRTRPG